MADPNQLLLFMAMQAQAQQQQQQAQQNQAQAQAQAQAQQQKKLQAEMLKMAQKAAAAAAAASQPSTSAASTSSASTSSEASTSGAPARNGAAQTVNANLLQQMAQVAQMGMIMAAAQQQQKQAQQAAAQKPKPPKNGTPKKATPTKPEPSTSNASQMTPEQTMAYQAMQLQALQMMMNPKSLEDAMVKKMVDAAVKKAASSGAAAAKASATPSTSSAATSSATPANGTANMVMQGLMLQAMAMQMQQQQKAQQAKETQKKADQVKKAKEAAKEAAKQQQKEQDEKVKQQEQLMKFVLAQQQLQLQKKQQKKQEEHAAMAAKVLTAHKKAMEGDDPDELKRSMEGMYRLPLQMGWRRQTCVRSMTAAGVKGDVSYFAPCGKKLSSYSETVRYLAKNGLNYITRDNFIFTTRYIIGEFVVPKQQDADDTRQEREFAMFTEEDVAKELARLIAIKFPPKVQHLPSTSSGASSSSTAAAAGVVQEEDQKPPVPKLDPPEEPLNLEDLNDEFSEEIMHSQMMSNGVDECKVRDRESDDLLVNFNDVRHLPEFSRIENQRLDAQGFADALMVFEFVQNFAHVLGIDLEIAPTLETLCAGLAGDGEHADEFLQLTRQLLRLALEFPGMGNEKRFGQGGGEMGLDRENFSEVMRIFLIDKGRRGQEISTPLESSSFLALTGEQKASILAFLCDELVCSRNVVTEIDRNLEEISRLKGEKWMREGKARALRQARSNKKKQDERMVKEEHLETDSEPPTRPVTPKKNTNTVSPQAQAQQQQLRKFTPGLGQCEVLTEQEESMTLAQMDGLIEDLHQEAVNINQKIHDTNQRIRTFPFGTDRFHRNYWMLAHTDTILVESLESSGVNNPACSASEYASKDPPYLEDRLPESACVGVDIDVIACVEDLVDEVVLQRARADKKMRKRYRRIENPVKRGWWTMKDRESIESLRSCMLSRGIRERALHRLLTKNWFLNDLKFGTITLKKVIEPQDMELIGRQGWIRLSQAIEKLRTHMKMADVARSDGSKPVVIPPSMALAQIVKDGVPWKTVEKDSDSMEPVEEAVIREKIIETARWVDQKFWRPKFRVPEGQETCQLFEDWKRFVLVEAATTSQLMVALQALEGMIMWERSSREALCQICKSMDGDEMLVCDGCESGCHMECFRPRMTKVPEGDWFCQRCRQEKSGKPLCLFCTRETGHLHQCTRCAYHVHEECARDGQGPKETIKPDTFICPHCQDIKQMRFVKRIMLRSESEEREFEEEEKRQAERLAENAENAAKNGAQPNGTQKVGGAVNNLKRKLEPVINGGMPRQMTKELCVLMLDELVNQANAAPFLEPVNGKLVPGYKMVIAKPIDLRTIRQKNEKTSYETPEDFAEDVELMFANCRQFNIDHSDIGRAGMNLHKFFVKRWKQLKYNFTKRLRRINRQS